MTSRSVAHRWMRPFGGAPALMGAALLGVSLILGGCGGGGGGGAADDGGSNYTPGDGPGSASLIWTAPAEREDGRPISAADLGGYRVHFGPVADPDQYVIDVSDGGSAGFTVTGLARDTWYFAVSAYDTEGQESSYSNSMTKVID